MKGKIFISTFLTVAAIITCFYGPPVEATQETAYELGIGAGMNLHGLETRQVLITPALSIPLGDKVFRLRLEGDLEFIEADGKILLVGGIAPFIRATLPGKVVRPFVEFGGGLNVANRENFVGRQLGGPFFFSGMAGAGIEVPWRSKVLSIFYRARHLSNGRLRTHNQGYNSQYLMVSLSL